jgi:hypothetical protein
MGNLRPFKLFRAALLKALKNDYFAEKSTKCIVKVYTLALEQIWVAHDWGRGLKYRKIS